MGREWKVEPTYTATIYVGRKDRKSGMSCSENDIKYVVQKYVDEVGLCVTLTRTEFIYTNGSESGFAIGLINYPRFPCPRAQLKFQAIELATNVAAMARQLKVSVVFPDETVMIGTEPVVE